jgi:alkylated DNA repair dioxygenase AlkB
MIPDAEFTGLSLDSWIEIGALPDDIQVDFEAIWNLHPPEFAEAIMCGRKVKTPRWQQSYLRSYFFSGLKHDALDLPEEIQPILDWANSLGVEPKFNQVLINWYENGLHYIGPHSDDVRPLVKRSPIFSISLGETRVFRVKSKIPGRVIDIPMPNRTVLVMGGDMQSEFTHEVPKVSGKRGAKLGRRVNITFRVFRA